MVSAGNWYSIKKKSYCDKEITFVMIVKCLLGLRAVNKKKKKKNIRNKLKVANEIFL
jgi:hypothetical protein